MLGLIQLVLLMYIRKESAKNKKVEMSVVRDYAKRELGVTSSDQVNITVRRLAERGLVDILPCKLVAYVPNNDNESQIASNVTMADRALKMM